MANTGRGARDRLGKNAESSAPDGCWWSFAATPGATLKYGCDPSDKTDGTELQMISIIGIVIVLGAIAAGYTMEHGNFRVLMVVFVPSALVMVRAAAPGCAAEGTT